MIHKKIFRTAVLLCMVAAPAFAQKQSFEGITKFSASSISPVYEKNEVKGYLLYYKSDKADKKNDNYVMGVYDQDLNKVKDIELQKPRNGYFMLRNAFNGTAFSFYFYNYSDKSLELETYDKSLNKLASVKIAEISKLDRAYLQQELNGAGDGVNDLLTGMNLFPVPGKGFIRNSYEGMGKSYELEMYDNNLKLKWQFKPDGKSKEYESIGVTEVTDKYLLATIVRRPNMLSKQMTFYVAAFDVNTGKKVLDQPIESKSTEQLSMSSMSFDEQKQEFVVYGEFYKAEDKPFVNKSQGIFMKRFDQKGALKTTSLYKWDKEVKALLPASASKSISENYINYVHKVIKGSNGYTYVVAEQYKIAVSGTGLAMQAMGGGTSAMKGKIGNMLVFVIDPANVMKEVRFYEKNETDCVLPAGSGLYGAGLLGHVIKTTGGFDYQFTQENNEATDFSFAYLDINSKSKDNKVSLKNVMKDNAEKFSADGVDIITGKNLKSATYPAKLGYNMIVSYNSGEKQMEMKLVKLNK